MISSIKLQRMSRLREAMLPFCKANREMVPVAAAVGSERSLYVRGHETPLVPQYVVITGDRGMCGRFNTNIIRALHAHISAREPQPKNVVLSCIGQKGYAILKRRGESVLHNYTECATHPSFETLRDAAADLIGDFTSGIVHEVWIVYSKRVSSFSEEPMVERILPFQSDGAAVDPGTGDDSMLLEEPSNVLVERYAALMVQGMLYEALVESGVAEHAARMSAMDNASSNCARMTGKYVQLRNRARQAAITTELNEIVTGKEALQS